MTSSILQDDAFAGMLDLSLLRKLLAFWKCKYSADWLEVLAFSKHKEYNNRSLIRAWILEDNWFMGVIDNSLISQQVYLSFQPFFA